MIALEQKLGGYKSGHIEKRINREWFLCQRWGAMKERRRSDCGCTSLGRQGGERVMGGLVYLGAELGCLITPSIMAALNKQAREEMHFHLHCCYFDPKSL